MNQTITMGQEPAVRAIGAKCKTIFRGIIRLAFCDKACTAVMAAVTAAIWWHILTTADADAAARQAAADACAVLPWITAMAIRDNRRHNRKGGAR